MPASQKLPKAFQLFDEANSKDPNTEFYDGREFPKELLYSIRMTETLQEFAPNASEALQLAARCQHICRWQIPRESYEMNRAGYLKWRNDLKEYHAKTAAELLDKAGYDQEMIDQVKFLLLKKRLKRNIESQTLEDVVCLVFLQYYFEPFMAKHPEKKLVDILQKTWKKMSVEGQKAATGLSISEEALTLIKKAIANGTK